MWLHLPQDKQKSNDCKAAIVAHLEGAKVFQNIMLIKAEGAKEAELSFCYEQAASLNAVVQAIIQAGAGIAGLYLLLPSSLSGVANVYDARDNGSSISGALQSIDGVIDAGVSNNGTIRMQCSADNPDDILRQAREMLLHGKESNH